jgi:hypothetical protein
VLAFLLVGASSKCVCALFSTRHSYAVTRSYNNYQTTYLTKILQISLSSLIICSVRCYPNTKIIKQLALEKISTLALRGQCLSMLG